MFFSFVYVVMLISPLSAVSRVVRERAAEVGLPYKRVCIMISDVPSVNTRRFVHRPHGEFRGRPMLHRNRTSRGKGLPRFGWLACVAVFALLQLTSARVLLLCHDVLYWDSSQSQRGRPFERAKARSAFRTEETGYIEASPLREITRKGRAMANSDPSACCLPDPHRAQCRNGRSTGMHRSCREWARRGCPALRGSWHWQIAAGGRTATIC